MRQRVLMAILGIASMLAVSACSTMQEKTFATDLHEEQANGAQFASWQHMGYSLFRGTPQTTTKRDILASQREKWWGQVVEGPAK